MKIKMAKLDEFVDLMVNGRGGQEQFPADSSQARAIPIMFLFICHDELKDRELGIGHSSTPARSAACSASISSISSISSQVNGRFLGLFSLNRCMGLQQRGLLQVWISLVE